MTRHVGTAAVQQRPAYRDPEPAGYAVEGRRDEPGRGDTLLRLACEIPSALADSEIPDIAIADALRLVCEAQRWAAGLYWRKDPLDGVLRADAGWAGDNRPVLRSARTMAMASGMALAGEVLRTGRTLWVPDLLSERRICGKELVCETGWTGELLAPVIRGGCTIGVVDFYATAMAQPDPGLLHVLDAFGRQLGDLIGRAEVIEQLRESEDRYGSMVELAAIGIGHVDPRGRFVHVNRQLCEMLGYSREELLRLSVREISHPDDQFVTAVDAARLHAGAIDFFKAEKRYIRKDRTPVWVSLTVASKRTADGTPLYDVSIVEDISARRAAEERVQYLAAHDELTGLTNRTLFAQLLGQAMEQHRRYGRNCAVLFVDLDRFKIVNDSLGHEGGDLLLREIAHRIRNTVRATDTVARFGGDEFALLIEVPDREAASVVARNVLAVVMKPVEVHGQECRVTASVGITLCPEHGDDPIRLLKNADLAMYLAKEEGKNNFQFYTPEISVLSGERIKIESCLHGALARGELTMHYQAKVDLRTGTIKGVEALMRWFHPELGLVSPATFIPIAEESDLILTMGNWALREACTQGATWLREGLPRIYMAVNLSPRQFRDSALVGTLAAILAETGMPPELLEVEITESLMMHDVEAAVTKLAAIRELGVRLAIDDFGTGYSSLAQLKRFPIDTLKVDRSFIRDLPTDTGDIAITEAIITLGRTLGVTVVAEGVETPAQQAFLQRRACDEMQGYVFNKPVPPEEFAELLRTYVPNPHCE